MKNTKPRIFTMLIFAIIQFSCEIENSSENKELNAITPEQIGIFHNRTMTNFKENYINSNIISESELTDDIITFNMNFLKSELRKNSIKLDTWFELQYQRELFDTKKLADNNFYGPNSKFTKKKTIVEFENFNLYDKIDYIYKKAIITSREKDLMWELINLHQKNYELLISDKDLKERVLLLELEFLNTNPNLDDYGSFFVAASIEISKYSNDWWELNYKELQRKNSVYSKSLIAPWLAADIIGGAASGLINIFEQGASSGFSESIDAGSVGWAMLKGAVTSSAAPWSRIARLF